MSFWKVDLTTRDGAENAAKSGANACFIVGALTIIYTGFRFAIGLSQDVAAISELVGAGIEAGLILIAGMRLRIGRGSYWGILAALLLVLELIMKIVLLSIGSFLTAAFLVVVVNGVRGAWALRRDSFDEDLAETFG